MNKVVLVGRMVKEAELKFIPGSGNAVATTTIAVRRRMKKEGQPEADFINLVIWGKLAENTATYTGKGSLISVSGRIETRSYDNKEGKKVYVTEVVCDEVEFLDKKGGQEKPSSNVVDNMRLIENEDIQLIDDGDIPF